MNNFLSQSEAAVDARARRAAKRVSLLAKKSTWRPGTVDSRGGYRLLDPFRNSIVAGERYDLTADAVIDYCSSE
jgi:hypothetical protein